MMHVLINIKSSNNINKWQVGFNSAFKGLMCYIRIWYCPYCIYWNNVRFMDLTIFSFPEFEEHQLTF
jgi:hypothetical protein